MGPALLIAHGRPADAFHDRIFAVAGKRARVAYVGAANGDDERWWSRVAGALTARHGARMTFARTINREDGAAARAALESADVIYVAGGDVELVAGRLRALELDALIRARHQAGAMLVGVSAGAIALGRFWIAFPGDGGRPSRFPCAGALPFAVDCHDEESDWEELRALLALWAEEEPAARVDAFGIPAEGALELDGELHVTPHGTPPKRLRLEGGAVIE